MKSYHFNLGNSTKGPIGFCARVKGNTKKEAISVLKEALEHFGEELNVMKSAGLSGCTDADFKGAQNLEYIEVYFNAKALKESSIDEVDEEEKKT